MPMRGHEDSPYSRTRQKRVRQWDDKGNAGVLDRCEPPAYKSKAKRSRGGGKWS